MKPLILVIAIAGGALLLQLWLPFWALPLVAFVAAIWLHPSPLAAFGAGLAAGALLWGGYAMMLNGANEAILATRIGAMLGQLPAEVPPYVSAGLGGLLAALGAMTGTLFRDLFVEKRRLV